MTLAKPALTTLSALALSAVVVTGVTQLADASGGTSGSTARPRRATRPTGPAGRTPAGPRGPRRPAVVRRPRRRRPRVPGEAPGHHAPRPRDVASRLAVLQQVRSAAADCSVAFPQARGSRSASQLWQGLTADQRACLAKVDLTRPIGPLTKEQRQARRQTLRTAAASCARHPPRRKS